MPTRFHATQSVEITVPRQPVPIQHYLRQPQRLVKALFDPNRVEQLSEEVFRLRLLPLAFMSLSIQPIVDLRVWSSADGTVHIRSLSCELRGLEALSERFALSLSGKLAPVATGGTTHLQGYADLNVQIDLPAPFCFTPKPFLETTGNGLLKSVLLTIKQRLTHQLLADYRKWSVDEALDSAAVSALLPVNNSVI